ncbi:hypothetical protein BJV82DRAFT_597042 [Fennellomyces sp. T-0311]|nr:hypothetical protein BJV82DRAFT_597042 [Fennellomyces sp. T-0311]
MAANKSLESTNPPVKKKTVQGTKPTGTKPTTTTQRAAPTVAVTDASPPEKILQSSWKFLYCYHFLSLFYTLLRIPSFTLETLENALKLTNASSLARSEARKLLEQILAALLKHARNRSTNTDSCHGHLYDFLSAQDISLSKPKDSWTIFDLAVADKIRALKSLIDMIESSDKIVYLRSDMPPEHMRLTPLGEDAEGWRYWMFNETRLYRELPMPQKKGMPIIGDREYTFELVCDTVEGWYACVSRFSVKTRNHNEKALGLQIVETIGPDVIAKLEAIEAAKAREEARLERLKRIEEMPRKRSRRLEAKSDELSKRRKTDELEEQRLALERYERQRLIKQQREEEALEGEQMKKNERELKNYVFQLIDDKLTTAMAHEENTDTRKRRSSPFIRDTPEIAFLKDLRGILRKSAHQEERVAKMRGWASILDDDSVVYMQKGPNEDAPLVLGQGLVLKGAGASGGKHTCLEMWLFQG